ncbi:MAG TPA: hypothetical protein DCR93_23215 [Cytophagales bacterium]|nr:hypothetical protein [Cytophagales bacterium]HAP62280.1 hypothetical protein [Cytophagales bacterium]
MKLSLHKKVQWKIWGTRPFIPLLNQKKEALETQEEKRSLKNGPFRSQPILLQIGNRQKPLE